MPGLNQTTQKNPCWLKTTKLLHHHHYRLLLVEGVDTLLTVLQCQAPADSVLQLIHINIISGPRLLAGGPSGLLHFVLRALRPLMPCDPRNDALDSEQTLVLVLLLLVSVVVVVLLLVDVVLSSLSFFSQKSNAHAHSLDWCACALDGVKIVGYEQGISWSRISRRKMPYLIARESYINSHCIVDGLPLNEIRLITEKSSSSNTDLKDERKRRVEFGSLHPSQHPRADRVQGDHQLLLCHWAQEVRLKGLHLDAVQAVMRGEASARNKPNRPECDVPVSGIPGTGNFYFFWWYRNRYRKKLVPEKSLGTGIGKIWYRKKSRNRYR